MIKQRIQQTSNMNPTFIYLTGIYYLLTVDVNSHHPGNEREKWQLILGASNIEVAKLVGS